MNPLTAYCVINAVGLLLAVAILRDRPTSKPERRPVPGHLTDGWTPAITTPPAPIDRSLWSDDDTVTWAWRGRRPRRAVLEPGPAFPGPVFADPPSPRFARQPRTDPLGRIPHTTTVAQAWDRWEKRRRPLRPVPAGRRVYVVPTLSRVDHSADTGLMKVVA